MPAFFVFHAAGGTMTPDELRARILHRDPNILVLDKPAGLPVHGGPAGRRSLEDLLGALALGNREPPRLAHRLDTDTSGCLVLARHPKALSRLGRLFSTGSVEKTYWAVVEGEPPAEEGTTDLPLSKRSDRTGWRMVPDRAGKPAVTRWRVLGRADGLCWLELHPRTGRTHQIRVHCAASGFPILGDPVYGRTGDAMLHLHARAVRIPALSPSRPEVAVTASPPPHMTARLRACGWTG